MGKVQILFENGPKTVKMWNLFKKYYSFFARDPRLGRQPRSPPRLSTQLIPPFVHFGFLFLICFWIYLFHAKKIKKIIDWLTDILFEFHILGFCLKPKVLDTETVSSSVTPVEVNVLFINLNQVACRLPYAASYRITLKQGGVPLSPPAVARAYSSEINLMAYDSVCYTCDTNTVQCTQKQVRYRSM